MFNDLRTEGLEESQDRLGGGFIKESDIYTGTVKVAYGTKSKKGATALNLVLDFEGKEYKETVYVSNKDGKNYWVDTKNGNKHIPLPGFTVAEELCIIITNKPLADQTVEDKMVNVWDPDLKKEVPKSVPVLTELTGQTVSVGILKQLENKSESDGNGGYTPTAETRETNTIDKVFHTETRLTYPEARDGKTEGGFWDGWISRNQGKTRDRTDKKLTGSGGNAGAPRSSSSGAGAAEAPRKSLFGGK